MFGHCPLRYRSEEIQHHCTLIQNLLNEVSAVQYKIDHGYRDRLHRGVLVHWEEWAPLRELQELICLPLKRLLVLPPIQLQRTPLSSIANLP